VDLQNDANNCGSCDNMCNDHAHCTSGNCACNAGWDNCDGDWSDGCETQLGTPANCSACGDDCTYINATGVCNGGVCEMGACDAGWDDCNLTDNDGCETQLGTLTNCSGCGDTCTYTNATGLCTSGACQMGACDSGWADCNSSDADGCETQMGTVQNCSDCGDACTYANAAGNCNAGNCEMGACNSGWGDCNFSDSDGCETQLGTVQNCAGCGDDCTYPNASGSCNSGTCQMGACNSGWGNCDASEANGCENSLDSLQDCGSCGTSCSRANATASCSGDVCHIETCNTFWDNCNGVDSDGCETSLETLTNCGACGVPCTGGGAQMSCDFGVCQIEDCNPGWGDCDANVTNGCETQLGTTANCSTCGDDCTVVFAHATGTCNSGTCQMGACDSGWGNCNGTTADGCETQLGTASNCSSCGDACTYAHASGSCNSGTCQMGACDSGWDDCNSSPSDGCETQLGTTSNCSGCGDACSYAHATGVCNSGSCLMGSCDSGWWDVDGSTSTGCECGDTSDAAGACNSAVAVGTVSTSNRTITRSGTIVHRTGYREDTDCFSVIYDDPAPAPGLLTIDFESDPGNLGFDVWRDGCGTQDCGGNDDTSFTSQCSSTGATCTSGNSHTFYVCVHAAAGQNNVCQPYTMRFVWSLAP